MRSTTVSVLLVVVGLLVTTTLSQASLTGNLDSAQFAYKYEANANTPDIEDTASGWTVGGNVTASVSDGALHYATSNTDSLIYCASTFVNNITPSTSYTVELRAKVTASGGAQPGIGVNLANDATFAWLSIGADGLQWEQDNVANDTFISVDNASDFHVFRVAFDSTAGKFQIWRDGTLVGQDFTTGIALTGYKRLIIGDGSSDGSGTADIDYIRWDMTGAYAPVPEPISMLLLAVGALFIRRK